MVNCLTLKEIVAIIVISFNNSKIKDIIANSGSSFFVFVFNNACPCVNLSVRSCNRFFIFLIVCPLRRFYFPLAYYKAKSFACERKLGSYARE